MVSKPLRAAFVCGNLARYNVNMLRAAGKQSGVQITVLQMNSREHHRQWTFSTEELDIRTLPGVKIPLNVRRAGDEIYYISPLLVSALRQGSYDVVVTSSWAQGHSLMTLGWAQLVRRPVILYEASIPHEASLLKRLTLPLVRRMIRRYSICIGGSTKCLEYLVWLGSTPDRVKLVRHPIDYEDFSQDASPEARRQNRMQLGLAADTPVALFVGRFFPGKGVFELLEAWRRLGSTTQARLVLIGSGDLELQLKEYISRNALAPTVQMIPFLQRDQLKTWYGAADFLVMPSHYDAFGAVAGEAMAAGLPVIATNQVGAEPDLIRHNESGLIVPAKDVEVLAGAMGRLLHDADARVQMGRRAQELASCYATPLVANEFLSALWAAVGHPLN